MYLLAGRYDLQSPPDSISLISEKLDESGNMTVETRDCVGINIRPLICGSSVDCHQDLIDISRCHERNNLTKCSSSAGDISVLQGQEEFQKRERMTIYCSHSSHSNISKLLQN